MLFCMALIQMAISFAIAEETKVPPVDPKELQSWWKAAGQLRLGDTAYRVSDELRFKDGVCDVSLNKGIVIPVYTGKAFDGLIELVKSNYFKSYY